MFRMMSPELNDALNRRFAFFARLGTFNCRGMHLVDPWPIGKRLGFSSDETECVLASLAEVGWIERVHHDGGERVALTVQGLARL